MNYLIKIYNGIKRIAEKKQIQELKARMKFCGKNVKIDATCSILAPGNLEIGENTSISSYTTIYSRYGVKIGKNCLISSNCGISSYNHIVESLNRPADIHLDAKYSKDILIGDNVWIGMNCCILPGIRIGNNSVIGSGSVVTKNVPENEIWVGNPARHLKNITF